MSAREQILNAVQANKPALKSLQDKYSGDIIRYEDKIAKFKTVLEGIGGKVIESSWNELKALFDKDKASDGFIVNAVGDLGKPDSAFVIASPNKLAAVDKLYVRGTLGVAENGCVWIKETAMINRLLPFITQHLLLVLSKENIVDTMHDAYDTINTFEEGFGVFIAGPSKTADIEQSLVIGAHGARSLIVYLV